MNVILDNELFTRVTWNNSYGNKLLHVFFGLRLAERYGGVLESNYLEELSDFVILKDSVVSMGGSQKGERTENSIVEISAFSMSGINGFVFSIFKRLENNLFISKWASFFGFSLKWRRAILLRSAKSYENMLNEIESLDEIYNVAIKGHFWHFNLMPSSKYLKETVAFSPCSLVAITGKYKYLSSPNSVAVHFRRTDFQAHMRTVFPESICLSLLYYERAIEKMEELLNEPIEFHLFGDDYEDAIHLFEGRSFVEHSDSAAKDWVALANTTNIIQSNSSFCWTAALFNSGISIQPSGGYNFHCSSEGDYPYGFKMKHSYTIDENGQIFQPGI